jgi:Fe-S cluster assembly protein SufB
MAASLDTVEQLREVTEQKYKYGFVTDIDADTAPKGLSPDIVRFISAKKEEPAWLLAWRLKAYEHWLTMPEPDWAKVSFPPLDYQDAYYYSAPKTTDGPKSLDEV